MKPLSPEALDPLVHLTVAEARHKRGQCLSVLDDLLTSLGARDEAASLDEIRAMFAAYRKPGMTTLSSDIETVREER